MPTSNQSTQLLSSTKVSLPKSPSYVYVPITGDREFRKQQRLLRISKRNRLNFIHKAIGHSLAMIILAAGMFLGSYYFFNSESYYKREDLLKANHNLMTVIYRSNIGKCYHCMNNHPLIHDMGYGWSHSDKDKLGKMIVKPCANNGIWTYAEELGLNAKQFYREVRREATN